MLVKPHPNAVLPAALTVAILRKVLTEQGLDPNVVSLALCPKPADTQALATDEQLVLDERAAGLLAAMVAILLRAPLLVVVVVAAATAAGLRAI